MADANLTSIAYCGLYCGGCPAREGKVADMARDLRRELRRVRFDKMAEALARVPWFKDFESYDTCYEVLGGMVKMRCGRLCREGGGNPQCAIRRCAKERKLAGCWECGEMKGCEKLTILETSHGDAHRKNLTNLKRKGVEGFLAGKQHWYSKPRAPKGGTA